MVSQQSVFIINVLGAGEMDRNKDLSDLDKGQIMVLNLLFQPSVSGLHKPYHFPSKYAQC